MLRSCFQWSDGMSNPDSYRDIAVGIQLC